MESRFYFENAFSRSLHMTDFCEKSSHSVLAQLALGDSLHHLTSDFLDNGTTGGGGGGGDHNSTIGTPRKQKIL